MSRIWKRAQLDSVCGFCIPPRRIAYGEPALYVKLDGLKDAKIRCADCAGEPVPDGLDEVLAIKTSGFTKLSKAAPARTRGALKAAVKEWMPYKEREAGEEG